MLFGYNTNGFVYHRFEDALEILAQLGYGGVAITLDHGVLDPYHPRTGMDAPAVRRRLEHLGLRSVIEGGARYVVDPWRRHQPTLISPNEHDRARRIDFIKRGIDLASELGSEVVTYWSGVPVDQPGRQELEDRLTRSLEPVIAHAERRSVPIACEPEPEMFLNTVDATLQYLERFDSKFVGVTADTGHEFCQSIKDIPAVLRRAGRRLFNIHVEDMREGIHQHLQFGDGEMDYPPILQALHDMGYQGGVYVELSGHSADAVDAARAALAYLKSIDPSAASQTR